MITSINTLQIRPGTICRANMNTTVSGSALLTRLLVPANNPGVVMVSSTGADTGTGDVTIDLNYSYLNDLYATQAWVIAQHYLNSFTESDPVFLSSPAYTITSGDINSWNTAYSKYPIGLSVVGSTAKTIALRLSDNSVLSAPFTDLTGSGGSGSVGTLDQVTSIGNTTSNSIVVGGITDTAIINGVGNAQYISTDLNGLLQLMPLHWILDLSLGYPKLVPNIALIVDLRGRGLMESNFVLVNTSPPPSPIYIVADKDHNIINAFPGFLMSVCLPSAIKYPGRVLKIRAAAQTSRIVFTDPTGVPIDVVVLQVQGAGSYQYLTGISSPGGAYLNEWIEILSADLSGNGDYYWLVTQYR